mmetsp:Transcript_28157/g.65131  ORF Transcript_28157/g.65131 Transcript_28157/m.65131 type:complete len:134 (-) Transcript_28157:213-614(-)
MNTKFDYKEKFACVDGRGRCGSQEGIQSPIPGQRDGCPLLLSIDLNKGHATTYVTCMVEPTVLSSRSMQATTQQNLHDYTGTTARDSPTFSNDRPSKWSWGGHHVGRHQSVHVMRSYNLHLPFGSPNPDKAKR